MRITWEREEYTPEDDCGDGRDEEEGEEEAEAEAEADTEPSTKYFSKIGK